MVLSAADIFRGKVVDVAHDSVTVEVTGAQNKIDAFLQILGPMGIIELIRTGMVAIPRGKKEPKSQRQGLMISPVGHYEPIAREGYPFIIPPALVAFGFWWYSYPWISFLFLLISVGIALFFRNPERATPEDVEIALAPADGRVCTN